MSQLLEDLFGRAIVVDGVAADVALAGGADRPGEGEGDGSRFAGGEDEVEFGDAPRREPE